jgi:hypothetical protein
MVRDVAGGGVGCTVAFVEVWWQPRLLVGFPFVPQVKNGLWPSGLQDKEAPRKQCHSGVLNILCLHLHDVTPPPCLLSPCRQRLSELRASQAHAISSSSSSSIKAGRLHGASQPHIGRAATATSAASLAGGAVVTNGGEAEESQLATAAAGPATVRGWGSFSGVGQLRAMSWTGCKPSTAAAAAAAEHVKTGSGAGSVAHSCSSVGLLRCSRGLSEAKVRPGLQALLKGMPVKPGHELP